MTDKQICTRRFTARRKWLARSAELWATGRSSELCTPRPNERLREEVRHAAAVEAARIEHDYPGNPDADGAPCGRPLPCPEHSSSPS